MISLKDVTLETFTSGIFETLFTYKRGVFFWPLFAYYFADYFRLAGVAFCWTMVITLISVQFLRTLKRAPFLDWNKEIILITGGAHGVGKQFVMSIKEKHNPFKIIILDIANPTYDLPNVFWYSCNVGNLSAVKETAEKVITEHGSPTIVINNAGIVKAKKFVDLTEQDIQTVVDVNLMSCMWVTKAFLPAMIAADKGHIVNVASVLGLSGCGRVADYCATKAGMIGFHESLRQELIPTFELALIIRNINMTLIYPGLIETGMFTGMHHITPHLKPHQVSDAIIKNLESGYSADIKLPTYANFLGVVARGLPIEIADFLREITGANNEMATFQHSVSAVSTEKKEE